MRCLFLALICIPALSHAAKNATVLILGAGVSGIIAARTLYQHGINDFVVIEARDEIGGRMKTYNLSGTIVELGPNWIQGTQRGNGPENPILALAKKWGVTTRLNDLYRSVSTYDFNGAVNFRNAFDKSVDHFADLTVGAGLRIEKSLVDSPASTGYSLIGAKAKTHHAQASEYYQYDFEYAQSPDQSSWLASAWNSNFTYNPDQGGFADENLLAIDQRGFKTLIKAEAGSFLHPEQLMLKSLVKTIRYSNNGVGVILENGQRISGLYAICTFSLGVLQNDEVTFEPELPEYKREAIESMVMATYTKIFLKFSDHFWFDTEMALYADKERGRYPVWQSLDHVKFLPGSGVIFVTVTGDYSERIEALTDVQVREEVLGVLQSMFPNITIPPPVDFHFTRWQSDPLFRGSYSNWPPSFYPQHHENLRANVGRLYFAGEATSERYFGFLHGAYFEGLWVGNWIARCIGLRDDGCELPHVDQVNAGLRYPLS